MRVSTRRRKGFSLVELVVVVLIIAIIAAIAAPRMFNTATEARESSARQNLSVIRNAIELYAAQNEGAYPGTDEATFKTEMEKLLQGPFPECSVGAKDATVRVQTSGAALTVSGAQSWAYDNQTGEFIINDSDYSTW